MKNRAQTRALAVIAITLAAALSACGSTSSTTSGQKNNPSASSSNAASQDANLIFAQCMREKGFDVPDTGLTPDNVKDPEPGKGVDIQDVPQDALNKCFGNPGGSK